MEQLETRNLLAGDLMSSMSNVMPSVVETDDACVFIGGSTASAAPQTAALASGTPQQEDWVGAIKPNKGIGPWQATSNGDADFVFGVPSNFTGFANAKVVAIAKETTSTKYDVSVSVAKAGEPALGSTNKLSNQGPMTLLKGRIIEIDVRAAFPGGLEAGQDNIALNFTANKKSSLHILGLRFVYEGVAGPQGPQGVAGPAGADGADGPVGPIGPAGPQGFVGPAGADGAVGPQGPAGVDGADGAQGPAGVVDPDEVASIVDTVIAGGIDGDLEIGGSVHVGGSVQLGDSISTCDASAAGVVKFDSGSFEGCDGNGWAPIAFGEPTVQRDFLTWNTTATGATPVHIKTNIAAGSHVMYRIAVEGYNFGMAQAINSDVAGYTYSQSPTNIHSATANNYAPGAPISQYISSDGYVVIKLEPVSTYYMGFSASGWFTNPAGYGFEVSAVVSMQVPNL